MLKRLRSVFASLHALDVKYVVIGGIAAIAHGVPRTTFDLDILVEATLENVKRLLKAFEAAGLGTTALTTPEEVLSREITIFSDFVRIDVQTITPGLLFKDAWERKLVMTHEGQEFFVASREDLIASKRATGRPRDLEDVRILERTRGENR